MLPIKEEIHDLLILVSNGGAMVSDADSYMEAIFLDMVGDDEHLEDGMVSGFPDKWGDTDRFSAKKTWIHARNHLRRGMRSKYRG